MSYRMYPSAGNWPSHPDGFSSYPSSHVRVIATSYLPLHSQPYSLLCRLTSCSHALFYLLLSHHISLTSIPFCLSPYLLCCTYWCEGGQPGVNDSGDSSPATSILPSVFSPLAAILFLVLLIKMISHIDTSCTQLQDVVYDCSRCISSLVPFSNTSAERAAGPVESTSGRRHAFHTVELPCYLSLSHPSDFSHESTMRLSGHPRRTS